MALQQARALTHPTSDPPSTFRATAIILYRFIESDINTIGDIELRQLGSPREACRPVACRSALFSPFLCGVDHRQDQRAVRWVSIDFQGGALCRTIHESMRWNACAWRQTASNWQAALLALRCKSISLRWRCSGPPSQLAGRARIPSFMIGPITISARVDLSPFTPSSRITLHSR